MMRRSRYGQQNTGAKMKASIVVAQPPELQRQCAESAGEKKPTIRQAAGPNRMRVCRCRAGRLTIGSSIELFVVVILLASSLATACYFVPLTLPLRDTITTSATNKSQLRETRSFHDKSDNLQIERSPPDQQLKKPSNVSKDTDIENVAATVHNLSNGLSNYIFNRLTTTTLVTLHDNGPLSSIVHRRPEATPFSHVVGQQSALIVEQHTPVPGAIVKRQVTGRTVPVSSYTSLVCPPSVGDINTKECSAAYLPTVATLEKQNEELIELLAQFYAHTKLIQDRYSLESLLNKQQQSAPTSSVSIYREKKIQTLKRDEEEEEETMKDEFGTDEESLMKWLKRSQEKYSSLTNATFELLKEYPNRTIIVCENGPKILILPDRRDIVYCYTSEQWIAKLWSDIENSLTLAHYPIIILNILIFLFGTTGNIFVCLSVYRNHQLRNVTNYFIVNLAFADLLVILICLPATVVWDLSLTWFFGTIPCKLIMFLQDVSISVSVLTLTAISIDRYYAICYPLRFKSNLSQAKRIIALIWLVSLLIMAPDLIYLNAHASEELSEAGLQTILYSDCNYDWSHKCSRLFQFVKTFLLYLVPFILMLVAHFRILQALKAASASFFQTSSTSAALSPTAPDGRSSSSSQLLLLSQPSQQQQHKLNGHYHHHQTHLESSYSYDRKSHHQERRLRSPAEVAIASLRGIQAINCLEPTTAANSVQASTDVDGPRPSADSISASCVDPPASQASSTTLREKAASTTTGGTAATSGNHQKVTGSSSNDRQVGQASANVITAPGSATTSRATTTSRSDRRRGLCYSVISGQGRLAARLGTNLGRLVGRSVRVGLPVTPPEPGSTETNELLQKLAEGRVVVMENGNVNKSAAAFRQAVVCETSLVIGVNRSTEKGATPLSSFQQNKRRGTWSQSAAKQRQLQVTMHNKSKLESRRTAAKMLMTIVILFGICYLPVHLINSLRQFIENIPQTDVTSTISMLAHCICYLNSAINPIIYNHMNSIFRAEFKRFLSCLCWLPKPPGNQQQQLQHQAAQNQTTDRKTLTASAAAAAAVGSTTFATVAAANSTFVSLDMIPEANTSQSSLHVVDLPQANSNNNNDIVRKGATTPANYS